MQLSERSVSTKHSESLFNMRSGSMVESLCTKEEKRPEDLGLNNLKTRILEFVLNTEQKMKKLESKIDNLNDENIRMKRLLNSSHSSQTS